MNRAKIAKLAIVTPWFGDGLVGGAERQAWQLARRLAARGHTVDILTTCCMSFFDDWAVNHHNEGAQVEQGFTIRRFPVSQRNREKFDALNASLLAIPRTGLRPGISPVGEDDARIWASHNINSRRLEAHLERGKHDYDAFIFLPYLYGPTLNGLRIVKERAWLQPCLHDEAYAYLPSVQQAFFDAHRLLFNSEGEQQLAARLYGPIAHSRGLVVGEGIEPFDLNEAARVPECIGECRFVLCLGRRCVEKDTDALVKTFATYKAHHPRSRLMLVLAGPGEGSYEDAAQDIVDLGYVSNAERSALLARCTALCQPSRNESFSRVLFEAWHLGKPVLVNGECLATSLLVDKAGGGWVLRDTGAWCECFSTIEHAPGTLLVRLGESGRNYASEVANWDRVIDRYEHLLVPPAANIRCRTRLQEVHQLLPNLSYGDAVSSHALQIREELRRRGLASKIFVREVDARLASEACTLDERQPPSGAGLIYHHSIGTEAVGFALQHAGPRCLVYHNITPPEFFRPYRPQLARLLREGREQLWNLAHAFPSAAGVSPYNVRELADFGFERTTLLPLPVGDEKWASPANPEVLSRLDDDMQNLLFVGRIAPNKRQDELVEFFAYYQRVQPTSRLILAGASEPGDAYARRIGRLIRIHGLEEKVIVTGAVTDEVLHALYRTASAFLCFSEHEGFCVPLVEAMWFEVPIVAFHCTAISETLDGAGILLESKNDFDTIAETIRRIDEDPVYRYELIERQRSTRRQYLPERSLPGLAELLYTMEQHLER